MNCKCHSKCHTCWKTINYNNYYILYGNFYYCSLLCFNHI